MAARYREDGIVAPDDTEKSRFLLQSSRNPPVELEKNGCVKDRRRDSKLSMRPPASGSYCRTCSAGWPCEIPCALNPNSRAPAPAPTDAKGWIATIEQLERMPRTVAEIFLGDVPDATAGKRPRFAAILCRSDRKWLTPDTALAAKPKLPPDFWKSAEISYNFEQLLHQT
jgi:hypothetical protein